MEFVNAFFLGLVSLEFALKYGRAHAGSSQGGESSLAPTRCSEGAGFWCESRENAELCHRVQYCIEHYWTESEVCSSCQQLGKSILTFSEHEVKLLANKMCSYISYKLVRLSCDYFLKNFYHSLWHGLEKHMNLKSICGRLHACTPADKFNREGDCENCRSVAGYIEPVIKISGVVAVRGMCRLAPFRSRKKCKCMADSTYPTLWDQIKSHLRAKKMCSIIDECPEASVRYRGRRSVHSTTALQVPSKTSIGILKSYSECQLCEILVTLLSKNENQSMSEVEDNFLDVCSALNDSYYSKCIAMKNRMLSLLAEDKLNYTTGCFELCGPESVDVAHDLLPTEEKCLRCKRVVDATVRMLFNTSYLKSSIEVQLWQACHNQTDLTRAISCNFFKQNYFHAYWARVVDSLANSCQDYQPCITNTSTATNSSQHSIDVKDDDVEGLTCSRCTAFTKDIAETFLIDPDGSTENRSLNESCRAVFPSFSPYMCMVLINLTLSAVRQNSYNGKALCAHLGVCNDESSAESQPLDNDEQEAIQCELCLLATKFIGAFQTSDNATEVQLVRMMSEEFCSYFSADFAEKCADFVTDNAVAFYRLLSNDADPKQLCTLYEFCSLSTNDSDFGSSTQMDCIGCLAHLDNLKKELPNEANRVLPDFCASKHSLDSQVCMSVTKEFGPVVAELLADVINPDQDCKLMQLCPAQ